MNDCLYENSNYIVKVGKSVLGVETYTKDGGVILEYPDIYQVINKDSGLIENEERNLPAAFSNAEQMDRVLRLQIWKTNAEERYPDPREDISDLVETAEAELSH